MSTVMFILNTLALWVLISTFLIYSTWVHFAAIMRMKALRDTGDIEKDKDRVLWVFGSCMLLVGLVLDVALQFIVISPAMLELPVVVKWKERGHDMYPVFEIEWLTTSRFIRWNKTKSTSWWTRKVRRPIVEIGKMLLDKVDTEGLHIR